MNDQNLEPAAEELLRAGKSADDLSANPPLYSIAISLKRIADSLENNPSIAEQFEKIHGYKP